MNRKTPFVIGEVYHCYSRGIDKRSVFMEERDIRRFWELLYLSNGSEPVRRADMGMQHRDIFSVDRGQPSTSIIAYAIMGNHYHLVLAEREAGGISRFMQSLGVAYTKYFNLKYDRIGNLFVRPFRSRHVDTDDYFQHLIRYVHANPIEMLESTEVRTPESLAHALEHYPYSSLQDYLGVVRPQATILDYEWKDRVYPTTGSDLVSMQSQSDRLRAENLSD